MVRIPNRTLCAKLKKISLYKTGVKNVQSCSKKLVKALYIRVSAKISRGKKLIGALEVSYSASHYVPLSAKEKAD
jgi:hypothetical protein